jgi:hypothetical protein
MPRNKKKAQEREKVNDEVLIFVANYVLTRFPGEFELPKLTPSKPDDSLKDQIKYNFMKTVQYNIKPKKGVEFDDESYVEETYALVARIKKVASELTTERKKYAEQLHCSPYFISKAVKLFKWWIHCAIAKEFAEDED